MPHQITRLVIPFFIILSALRYYADGSSNSGSSSEKELTFGMIKPDGVAGNYTDSIKKMILEAGFEISEEVTVHLDENTVRNFYVEHSSKSFFSSLLRYMTSGPVLIMLLEKENAVADWRALIGPTDSQTAKVTHPHSIRAMCGVDLERNCVHGSDSPQSAAREIFFFFKRIPSGSTHDEL